MQSNTTHLQFDAILEALRTQRFSARTGWWIALVCAECILDPANHHALFKGNTLAYRANDQCFSLEFSLEGGWIDRRHLQPTTVVNMVRNQGCFFERRDLNEVDRELATVFNLGEGRHHRMVIAASHKHWADRIPGVLFGHCSGTDRFQLLDRYAMWREATQAIALFSKERDGELAMDFLAWPQSSDSVVIAEHVAKMIVDIAKRKGSREAGRAQMVECIDHQFPAAKAEGQMQALALLCLKEVIGTGGMSGRLLAPSSISTYLGNTFVPWVQGLIDLGMESEPEAYVKRYTAIIAAHPSSRQGQAKALIDVLHTRLVLRGAPFLRAPRQSQLPSIPKAQVIWPHEAELALQYIDRATSDRRLAAQARLIVLLGLEVPLRTSEYFRIRLVDVCPKGIASLVVYPRRRDGKHKSSHNRLHTDISNEALCNELLSYKAIRCAEEALPSEDTSADLFYLGKPGYPGEAYAEGETIELVNCALRWATGDSLATVYSLRHTVISARALACFESPGQTDEVAWDSMSKQCGHGNPDSTNGYVHQIEKSLQRAIARNLPAEILQHFTEDIVVPDLHGMYAAQVRKTESPVPLLPQRRLQDLSFAEFLDLMEELAADTETPVLNAKFYLVEEALGQLFRVTKQRWSSRANRLLTERDVRVAILEWGPRSKHFQQHKYTAFRKYLQTTSLNTITISNLAAALEDCCLEVDIALDTGYWSEMLLQHLDAAGYSKREIVLFAERVNVLPDVVARHGAWRVQSARKGRPSIRLGLVDSRVGTPAGASGAAYSATGLMWASVVLNLWLAIKGAT